MRTLKNLNRYFCQFEKVIKTEKKTIDRLSMTPHQYYITQRGHMEKPETGQYILWSETGHYNCINCEQQLFKSEQKLVDRIGYASFYNYIKENVILGDKEEVKIDKRVFNPLYVHLEQLLMNSVRCSCCNSFIGALIQDNTPPFYHKICVNSASVYFQDKEHFSDPIELKKERKKVFLEIDKQRKWKELTKKDKFDEQEYLDISEYIRKNKQLGQINYL